MLVHFDNRVEHFVDFSHQHQQAAVLQNRGTRTSIASKANG